MAGAVEKAYAVLRERIGRGAYPPGARITEQEISSIARVSRTPAREALRRLQAEGFVRVTPNQGAFVPEWTEEDIDDIFGLRALIEPYGAARAAERIGAEDLAEVRRLADEQYREATQRGPGYLQRIGDLNSRFHRTLHRVAGSARLVATIQSLIEAPLILQTFSRYSEEDLVRSAAHHLEIVAALEARDSQWAASLMRAHVLAARNAMRAKLPAGTIAGFTPGRSDSPAPGAPGREDDG